MKQKTAIIIVNYNAGEALMTCLRSIYESQTNPFVVVVDNASRDGSIEKCRQSYGRVQLIINSENVGFAAGVNSGIRFALERGASEVVLINPDAVVDKNCLQNLTQALRDPSVGIAAPLIYRLQDKTLWFAGGWIDYKKQRVEHSVQIPQENEMIETDFITGCVMAIKADVFQNAELFDERFFLYYEDADFVKRVREIGWKAVVVPRAIAWHAEQSEAQPISKTYYLVLSGLLFFHKHAQGVERLRVMTYIKMRQVVCDIKVLFVGDEKSKAIQKAFKDFRYATQYKKITPISTHRSF